MKPLKKLLVLGVSILLTSCNTGAGEIQYGFDFETNFEKGYNKNLWYKNDLEQKCADPSIIYCEEDGYYYMYMTSDTLGASGFNVYRSKQLNYWEELSPAYLPDPYSWGITNLWAPNIIKIGDLYYLYYSAYNHTTREKGISVAVASHPAGPFHEYEGFDYYGNTITRGDQVFNFGFPAIDAAPFMDDNGDLYLYFAKDQVNSISDSYGVRLLDPVTADLSTITFLATPAKSTIDRGDYDLPWEIQFRGGKWNEAPYMLKLGDKYYLTYSANMFEGSSYAVGYAIGDSPLGRFEKPHAYPTENLLLGVDPDDSRSMWDFMSGPGHHCFFYAGDELMCGYHAHIDRYYGDISMGRAFALDKVIVRDDGKLHINGPTWSLMPLPESVSGYANIASEATLTADADDNELLVDEMIPMHQYNSEQVNMQANFTSGNHTLKFEFEEERDVTAVAIYNSLKYETAITKVNKVNIEGYGEAYDIPFNKEYMDNYMEEYDVEYIRPGCPFICEFFETKTKTITIELSSDHNFSLSEIVILGRAQ